MALLVLAGQAGCTGVLGGAGDDDSDPGGGDGTVPNNTPTAMDPPPTDLPQESACVSNSPGPRMLRRLTAEQLDATMRDLFRDPSVPTAEIFSDPQVLGFTSDADALIIRDLTSQQLMNYAEQVAHWAVQNHLSELSSCTSTDPSCREQFIRDFGRRAFRAPLKDERVRAYDAIFAAEGSFSDGVEAVVSAMLQSPYFLYRREIGTPDQADASVYKLDAHEIASNLSYLITGTMPDDELLAAADSGSLSTPEQIEAQAQRLLQDPRSQDEVMRFMSGWLQLDRLRTTVKNNAVFDLTDALRAEMLRETRSLVVDTVFNQNGTFSDLLTARYSFLTGDLAAHYGISGASGSEPTKVSYESGQREPGLLAHASILTGHASADRSSPVQRGKLVRTRLLCRTIDPPPASVDTNIKPPENPTTTRDLYTQHTTAEYCAGCHKKMDPIGFGFEHYDVVGRYRDAENGYPIDSSGQIIDAGPEDVTFNGVTELSDYLAANDDVKACMVRYWAYYAYGAASWNEDGCTYDAVKAEAAAKNFTIQSVWLALTRARHFTQRVQGP